MRNRFVAVHATTKTVPMVAFRFRLVYPSVMSSIQVQIRQPVNGYVGTASFIAATHQQVLELTVLSHISIGTVLYKDLYFCPGLDNISILINPFGCLFVLQICPHTSSLWLQSSKERVVLPIYVDCTNSRACSPRAY
jgi:hypothetical protein